MQEVQLPFYSLGVQSNMKDSLKISCLIGLVLLGMMQYPIKAAANLQIVSTKNIGSSPHMISQKDPWKERKGWFLSIEGASGVQVSPIQGMLRNPVLYSLFGGGYYFPTDCSLKLPLCIDGMMYLQLGGNMISASMYALLGVGSDFFFGHQHRFALTTRAGLGYGYHQLDKFIDVNTIQIVKDNNLMLHNSVGILGRMTPTFDLYLNLTNMTSMNPFIAGHTDFLFVVGTQFRP